MDRKRLIVATALLVILAGMSIFAASLFRSRWESQQGRMGHRIPLQGLSYCSSRQVRPCILSFNLDPQGGMLVNVLVHGSTPDFYLRIRHAAGEEMYYCEKAGLYSAYVLCTGKTMPLGQTMSFRLVSLEGDATLAEGSFPIIGMALATPDVYFTPTPVTLERLPR